MSHLKPVPLIYQRTRLIYTNFYFNHGLSQCPAGLTSCRTEHPSSSLTWPRRLQQLVSGKGAVFEPALGPGSCACTTVTLPQPAAPQLGCGDPDFQGVENWTKTWQLEAEPVPVFFPSLSPNCGTGTAQSCMSPVQMEAVPPLQLGGRGQGKWQQGGHSFQLADLGPASLLPSSSIAAFWLHRLSGFVSCMLPAHGLSNDFSTWMGS